MLHIQRASRNLVLSGVSLLIALAAAEGLVRLVAPQDARIQSPGMYRRDSVPAYRFSANYTGRQSNRLEYSVNIHTDDDGLRIPVTGPPSQRRRRILLLGDSFVFGQGVEAEDALPSQLERDLASHGDSVTVLNGGVPGYSTRDEVAWFRHYGMALRPDEVILGVFLGNDLQDNRTSAESRFLSGIITAPPRRWYTPVTQWAYEHLELYDLVRKAVTTWRNSRRQNGLPADVAHLARKYRPSTDRLRRQELAASDAAIAEFANIVKTNHIRGTAVLLPESPQVEPRRIRSLRKRLPDSIQIDLDYPNRLFEGFLTAHEVPWIDLTASLRKYAARGDVLYYPVDGHWTQLGNATAAEILADSMLADRDRLFLPKREPPVP